MKPAHPHCGKGFGAIAYGKRNGFACRANQKATGIAECAVALAVNVAENYRITGALSP
jgi:hypothetical protein